MKLQNHDINRPVVLAVGCITLISIAASVWFSPLTWGINYYAFLPWQLSAGCLALLVGVIIGRNAISQGLLRLAKFAEMHSAVFVGACIALFSAGVIVLRVRVPLLGDSFFLLKNFENTSEGFHSLHLAREPLATFYFYWCAGLLGVSKFPEILNAFVVGEILLGSVFILIIYRVSRELAVDGSVRLYLFFWLLGGRYMQVFFGYAEVYSVVLVAEVLFLLTVLLYLNSKLNFILVVCAFVFLTATHFIALVFLPALAFLFYVEKSREGSWNLQMFSAAVILMAVVLGVFVLPRLMPVSFANQDSHFLNVSVVSVDSHVYTIFSRFHLIDLVNLILLQSPFVFILPFHTLLQKRLKEYSALEMFLIVNALCVFLFLIIAKFDLGMAKDWDAAASLLFMIQILVGYLFFAKNSASTSNLGPVLLAISMLQLGTFLYLNASHGPALARYASLADERLLSADAYYATYSHLDSYYDATGNLEGQLQLWEDYTKRFPNRSDGYHNLTATLSQSPHPDIVRVHQLFDKWLALDSTNSDARLNYATFCSFCGSNAYQYRHFEVAEMELRKSIALDSTRADVYNELAITRIALQQVESAVPLLKKAIALDGNYALAYSNLANIMLSQSHFDDAIDLYLTSVRLNPSLIDSYRNLGLAYGQLGKFEEAKRAFRSAAELGDSISTQQLNAIKESN